MKRRVADGRVEGRNHADDQHLALVVGQRARGEIIGQHGEVRGRFADGNALAEKGQGIALESDDAGAFLNHNKPPSPKKRERSVVL